MITAILLGILLGLIGGMLPGIGNTLIIMLMFPVLLNWPPEVSIIFYVVCIQATSFSGSVSALNLGLLGDITSDPALRERPYILKNNLSDSALKFTAITSAVSCLISLLFLFMLLDWFKNNPVLLRTEIKLLLIYVITISCLWWPKNSHIKNLFLIITGLILTLIGHHENLIGFQDFHFLTFNITSLYAGIPTITILSSFLAVPALIKLQETLSQKIKNNDMLDKNNTVKYSWSSGIRGTLIGSILGFVPMIGAMISSNVSWTIEKLFQKNLSENQRSINRLISAESANNSSSITVLIPLLIFGLAIVPSEIILLSIIETQAWTPRKLMSFSYMNLGFYFWLTIGLISVCIFSYIFCYSLVLPVSKFLNKNIKKLTRITMFIITTIIMYSGWITNNLIFFILCFSVFSFIIYLMKKTEFMPLVVGFLLGDEILNSSSVVYNLYF